MTFMSEVSVLSDDLMLGCGRVAYIHFTRSGSKHIPKLYVKSGDTVDVEMLTHHAGDYYEGKYLPHKEIFES